jgi:transposase
LVDGYRTESDPAPVDPGGCICTTLQIRTDPNRIPSFKRLPASETQHVNAAATRACLLEVRGVVRDGGVMSRCTVLTDTDWARIEPLMPCSEGQRGRPFRDSRQVIEGIIYRLRTGIAWRDLPVVFGPWQTVWKRHRRFSADGTWDKIHPSPRRGRRSRRAGLAGHGRLHGEPRPSARQQHAPGRAAHRSHRGLSRMTRFWPVRPSRWTMRSAAPGVG